MSRLINSGIANGCKELREEKHRLSASYYEARMEFLQVKGVYEPHIRTGVQEHFGIVGEDKAPAGRPTHLSIMSGDGRLANRSGKIVTKQD